VRRCAIPLYLFIQNRLRVTQEYGEPAHNGLPLDDGVFTEAPAFGSEPAPIHAYSSFDTPANPFDEPSNPFDAPVNTTSFSAEPEEAEDPRTVWYRKNSEVLAQKDQAEREARQELVTKAQAHLEQVYAVRCNSFPPIHTCILPILLTHHSRRAFQTRKTTLQAKRDFNREAEKVSSGSLPAGETPWERVTSVINFNFDAHSQDVSRYKSLLITCKTNNVPVRLNQSSILPEEPAAIVLE
jgi:hypothetical protein